MELNRKFKQVVWWLKHFFVPHRHNNYRAKALHNDTLAVYLVVIMLLNLLWQYGQSRFPHILGYATDITTDRLFELTNKERINNGLPQLTYDSRLAQAAQMKANNMFQNNYWSHFGPNGETPWQFILRAGYKYEYAGENLAKNFMFSNDVVKAWMNSPTHRENIVNSHYTDVGFAVVNGILQGEPTTLVVQMFGKPPALDVNQIVAQVLPTNTPTPTPIKSLNVPPITVGKTAVAPSPTPLAIQGTLINNTPHFNWGGLFFNMRLFLILLLLTILIVDAHVVMKNNIVHAKGKNLAHILFLVFIIIGILTAVVHGSLV